MNGMRRNARNLCADLLKIRWRDGAGSVRKGYACLEDISTEGACFHVEELIPLDTDLTVLYPGGKYEGHVKYCVPQEGGHLIGIQFKAGYRWSRSQYDPPHLLRFRLAGDSDD